MSWMARIFDLWVIEHGQHAGFLLKARPPRRIAGEVRGQDLQRNIASEAGVASAVDLTHAASAQRRENFVRSEMSTRIQANGETPCPDRRKWRQPRVLLEWLEARGGRLASTAVLLAVSALSARVSSILMLGTPRRGACR